MAMAMLFLCMARHAHAVELADGLELIGVVAFAAQCQQFSEADDTCRSPTVLQPELNFSPDSRNHFHLKLGFASSNGLNSNLPVNLSAWAADLEDDVKDINGRGRDHLLTAWYRHDFRVAGPGDIQLTIGIIDATDYLDQNRYSNDEYSQFMNAALINAPSTLLPSYDAGAAFEWEAGDWSLRGVAMNVGDDGSGGSYDFLGVQLGRTVNSSLGEGNYRVVLAATSNDIAEPGGEREARGRQIILSFDQQFGANLGGFVRVDVQDDEIAIDYDALYSVGINVLGQAWSRPLDNVGIAYGYLDGGNLDIERSWVAEAYYRLGLRPQLWLTGDVQYIDEDLDQGADAKGWVFGLRASFKF